MLVGGAFAIKLEFSPQVTNGTENCFMNTVL